MDNGRGIAVLDRQLKRVKGKSLYISLSSTIRVMSKSSPIKSKMKTE